METFREQKRAARRQLHAALAEPVLYLKTRTEAPMVVTCRLHLQFEVVGDLSGSKGFAERQEVTPSIIFMNDQVLPRRDGIVITKDMGAYRVQVDLPPDDITTKAHVTTVEKEEVVKYGWNPEALWCGFPAPEGA